MDFKPGMIVYIAENFLNGKDPYVTMIIDEDDLTFHLHGVGWLGKNTLQTVARKAKKSEITLFAPEEVLDFYKKIGYTLYEYE
jgi:hypothetical protein